MGYARVVPRDLFNEGDLLNCLGRLWIKLDERRDHTGKLDGPAFPGDRFMVEQDESDGSIEVLNVTFSIDEFVCPRLFRPLNARAKWPLWCRAGEEDIRVFDDHGELSPEFVVLISQPELARRRGYRR